MAEQKIKWLNMISIIIFHIISIYGFFETILFANKATIYWIVFIGTLGGFGVTAGVHRLWCHRSYKATKGFRYFLAVCYSIAGQNTIFDWVRDHRVHHYHSDTDADPHNVKRGFWFSHVGWLMQKKHPKVINAGKKVQMLDILNDPVVIWHTKYFILLKMLCCFLIPIGFPVYFWNETMRVSILSQLFRYCLSLNATWSVNSFAHLFGNKPFDPHIFPSQNAWVSFFAVGEGWHNYHHVFPWDYKAAELPYYGLNWTTMFLDLAAYFNLVYDRKQPSPKIISQVKIRNTLLKAHTHEVRTSVRHSVGGDSNS